MPEFDEYGQIIPDSKKVVGGDIPEMPSGKRPQAPQRSTPPSPPPPPDKKKGPPFLIIGLVVLLLVCGGGGAVAFFALGNGGNGAPAEEAGNGAPAQEEPAEEAAAGDGSGTVVTIAYGTEKDAWMQEAKTRFEANNPDITIDLQGVGSREIVTQIVGGELQPTAISPASSLQIAMLRADWQTLNNADIIGADPQPLVITPLVLVAWQDRGEVLWPDGSSSEAIWQNLHDVMANPQGWAAFGHPDWGFAKFGHTNPETSNSGLQTLLLIAYDYHGKTSGLAPGDILDPGFETWLDEIETAVVEFGDSTGTFMTNMLEFGPSKYDAVAVYESLAIQNIGTAQERWGVPLRIYYPPANIISDHPYAVLQAEWVSEEQRAAAEQFGQFLLSEEMQTLALDYGFRPADVNIPIAETFEQYTEHGVQVQIGQTVEVPPGNVLNELVERWRRGDYE
jgi:ABC-type molybdate transport system substrate-binding protein